MWERVGLLPDSEGGNDDGNDSFVECRQNQRNGCCGAVRSWSHCHIARRCRRVPPQTTPLLWWPCHIWQRIYLQRQAQLRWRIRCTITGPFPRFWSDWWCCPRSFCSCPVDQRNNFFPANIDHAYSFLLYATFHALEMLPKVPARVQNSNGKPSVRGGGIS